MKWLYFFSVFLLSIPSFADFEHERIRRIVVFPVQTSSDIKLQADDLWWDLRDHLTQSKRFVVASRNFMQGKDVFQPRGELKPADAIILGRLLDANVLITTFLNGETLSMRVYDTRQGLILWSGDIALYPAVLAGQQIGDLGRKLLYDFFSAIPYQGTVLVDELIGFPMYREGEKRLFKTDVGVAHQVTVGDTAQLVKVKTQSTNPVFLQGLELDVYAEGRVVSVDRNVVVVEIGRMNDAAEVTDGALVRIPEEARRLKDLYAIQENPVKNVELSYLVKTDSDMTTEEKERKPLIVSLSFIGNLALLLLLAF